MKRATFSALSTDGAELNFNPRPREEGDVAAATMAVGAFAISIHALVKRATNKASDNVSNKRISIHALVKRATFVNKLRCIVKITFQSTPS